METRQIIQASANVVRISSFSAGDVYKRFDESYDDRVYFGVVTAIHNDGVNAIIEATEYSNRYNSISVDFKIMRGQKDYLIFPATPDDLKKDLEGCKKSIERDIESAKNTITEKQKLIAEIAGLFDDSTFAKLKAVSFKEMTQQDFNSKIQELN